MLLADPPPEDVVVGEGLPSLADLRGTAERCRIEIAEDLQRYLAWEHGEGIDADEMGELLAEERELGEAAHREKAVKNQSAARVWGRREVGPYCADSTSFFDR